MKKKSGKFSVVFAFIALIITFIFMFSCLGCEKKTEPSYNTWDKTDSIVAKIVDMDFEVGYGCSYCQLKFDTGQVVFIARDSINYKDIRIGQTGELEYYGNYCKWVPKKSPE